MTPQDWWLGLGFLAVFWWIRVEIILREHKDHIIELWKTDNQRRYLRGENPWKR